MKKNKLHLILFKLLLSIFFIYLIYLVYLYVSNSLYRTHDKFEDAKPIITQAPSTTQIPTTTKSFDEVSSESLKKRQEAENSSPQLIQEDSGKCGTNSDIIDYCTNYKTCCSKTTEDNKCLCSIPFIKDCRTTFEACLQNNPSKLSPNDLMSSCILENTSCCKKYMNVSIDSGNFSKPIKNQPIITPICSLTNIKNIAQKCMEVCQNKPECLAYSVNVGKIAQDIGTCNIYDRVNIVEPDIDPGTGKPKNNISTDYYTKK